MKESDQILTKTNQIETLRLHIRGLIQGVGFRPFIYRLALKNNLKGFVYNQNNGVVVALQGNSENKNNFLASLTPHASQAAVIESIGQELYFDKRFKEFEILASKNVDNAITRVSPDISVCNNCLDDMRRQKHRIDYPFINCTNCGPRFSIIENIPYDRPLTSMGIFEMCPKCNEEYHDINDRRFHAQPIACNSCGPAYALHTAKKSIGVFVDILETITDKLKQGGVVAIKGLGGYHLACDAFNPGAIQKLRDIKHRDGKPLALMFRSIDDVKKYANVSECEEQQLKSWQRPIVLLSTNYAFHCGIADNLNTVGAFLPYLPFHYQLFYALNLPALVMTSGNITHCPIITDDKQAVETFLPVCDAVLTHNRAIVNRVDDSVVQIVNESPQIIRRSRGFAPNPIHLDTCAEGILATGAELANTFCIGKGREAILSQHIGDIKNLETSEFFEHSLETYKRLFEFTPTHVVCDMHPEYISTKYAESLNLPIIRTQHHHAHIAATMAEYGLDETVIGVAYDGTGFGTDGKIWGSELMLASLDEFQREYHFAYVPIPGGDKVAEQPWRSAIAYLYQTYGAQLPKGLGFLKDLPKNDVKLVGIALDKQINTPESCSAGRLFDAVAALTNICTHASYHAEAPILLENAIEPNIQEAYSMELKRVIDWGGVIKQIVADLDKGISVPIISAKFHNTVVEITMAAIKKIHAETGVATVILSGGTFQNKYISNKLLDLLQLTGFNAYLSSRVPINDGGLSLGQLAIAAKTLALCV